MSLGHRDGRVLCFQEQLQHFVWNKQKEDCVVNMNSDIMVIQTKKTAASKTGNCSTETQQYINYLATMIKRVACHTNFFLFYCFSLGTWAELSAKQCDNDIINWRNSLNLTLICYNEHLCLCIYLFCLTVQANDSLVIWCTVEVSICACMCVCVIALHTQYNYVHHSVELQFYRCSVSHRCTPHSQIHVGKG